MSKVAIITDTHFGARNDSLPMQASQRKFLDRVFFPTLDQHGIKTVLHGGDYFDRRKYINFQTSQFVMDAYRTPLRKRGIQEIAIVGNHDIFYRATTELNAINEMYKGRHPDLTVLTEATEIDAGTNGILMVPWVTDSNRERTEKLLATSGCPVVLGHLEIRGFSMYRGMPGMEGLEGYTPDVFGRFNLVMSGHYHHRSTAGNVQYLGAPYPMIWSDYNDPRGFTLFDTNTQQLTFIENPYSIFRRLVYDDAGQTHDYVTNLCADIIQDDSPYAETYVKIVVKTKEQPYWFDTVVDALYKVGINDMVVVDDIIVNDEGHESQPTIDVDTLTLMREYVDSISISCDKSELMSYLAKKYQQALDASQAVGLS